MPTYESFALGGPLRLSGFRNNQFSGREYVFARAMYHHRIVALPDAELTQPALVMTPHQDAARAAHEPAWIGNREEVNAE